MKKKNTFGPINVYLCFTLLVASLFSWTLAASFAQEIDQTLVCRNELKNNTYRNDIKYVPFPKDLKKYEIYPWKILKMPEFNKSYQTILGSRSKEKWLRLLDGPSLPNKMLQAWQGRFVVVRSCKQHSCDTNKIVTPPKVPLW